MISRFEALDLAHARCSISRARLRRSRGSRAALQHLHRARRSRPAGCGSRARCSRRARPTAASRSERRSSLLHLHDVGDVLEDHDVAACAAFGIGRAARRRRRRGGARRPVAFAVAHARARARVAPPAGIGSISASPGSSSRGLRPERGASGTPVMRSASRVEGGDAPAASVVSRPLIRLSTVTLVERLQLRQVAGRCDRARRRRGAARPPARRQRRDQQRARRVHDPARAARAGSRRRGFDASQPRPRQQHRAVRRPRPPARRGAPPRSSSERRVERDQHVEEREDRIAAAGEVAPARSRRRCRWRC